MIDDVLSAPKLKNLESFDVIAPENSGVDPVVVKSTIRKFLAKTCKRGVVWWGGKGEVLSRHNLALYSFSFY